MCLASEGRACRLRCTTLDHTSLFCGHDRHAPPILSFRGIRLSRPPPNVRSSISFRRAPGVQPLPNPPRTRGGRKHFPPHAGGRKGGCTFAPLEEPPCQVHLWRDALVASAAQRWIIHLASSGTTSAPLRFTFRRDALVASGAQRWIIHPSSAGMTGMSLQFCLWEGPDERVPPESPLVSPRFGQAITRICHRRWFRGKQGYRRSFLDFPKDAEM